LKLWYLAWPNIATDRDAAGSTLCAPTSDDPCPLPPIRFRYDQTDFEYWLIALILGFSSENAVDALIEAPKVFFEGENRLKGEAPLALSFEDDIGSKLTKISATVGID